MHHRIKRHLPQLLPHHPIEIHDIENTHHLRDLHSQLLYQALRSRDTSACRQQIIDQDHFLLGVEAGEGVSLHLEDVRAVFFHVRCRHHISGKLTLLADRHAGEGEAGREERREEEAAGFKADDAGEG